MSVIRTIFLGTPFIARECLRALHEDEHFEVVGVISQPDRPAGRNMKLQASAVSQYAVEQNLPLICPEKAKGPEFIEAIKKMGAECAVVVAYGQILNKEFLELFYQRVVNVHASLLPRWRGAAPIQRAIMEGDKETGVCLQVMVKKLDAGDVLNYRKIKIENSMTAMDLHDAMIPLAQDLLKVDLMDYLRGHLSAKPQDEAQVTYAHKIDKSESVVDWNLPARTIFQRQRGLMMGPGSVTRLRGKRLKLIQIVVVDETSKGTPGEIVGLDGENIIVQCHPGRVQLMEVQPESRSRQTVKQFLAGHNIKTGEVFG